MKQLILFVSLFLCPMMAFGQAGNTAYGNNALGNNTTGSDNTAIGNLALLSNTIGSYNTAVGSSALRLNVSGVRNTATGYYALFANLGSDNTANGFHALVYNTSGWYNTATGAYALQNNTSGRENTATGYQALYSNTISRGNTATGYQALYSNATSDLSMGNHNTATGYQALYSNTDSYNTASGYYTLYYNTTGKENTAWGYYALTTNTIGLYNTAVGGYAGNANLSNNYSNSTCIGYNSRNDRSHQVAIGNWAVPDIGGYVNWRNFTSDGRVKKNIRADVPGLAFINLLQPVTYNLDLDAVEEIMKSDDPEINRLSDSIRLARSPEENEIWEKARFDKEKIIYSGFIAQDVEKAAQDVGYDFSGVAAPENDKSIYGIRYAEFVVPLVRAVQELSEQNNKLQEQINELTTKLDELMNAPKSQNEGVNDVDTKNFSFSLFPNPTNGFVTVDYTMLVDAMVFIELYDIFGKRVKLILPQQNQRTGQYSVQTSVANLSVGTYIVKVTSGNQVESKQLVVNN